MPHSIRKRTEQWEANQLASHATLASESRGRERREPQDSIRTVYQVDRDRILHSKAFRRLKHKTQVFIDPFGDHFRTRLTHALEVMQVGRTIGRALQLNEDLVEAICLGHDMGHTPFGHTGEAVLNTLLRDHFGMGFKHNAQSVRIAEKLEDDGAGLNLTWEVRDGLFHHPWAEGIPATPEGWTARLSDRLAYINHDLDDAFRAGVIKPADLPAAATKVLGTKRSARFDILVGDAIEFSTGKAHITFSPRVKAAFLALYKFMFEQVYLSPRARAEADKAGRVVKSLFHYYLDHPQALPDEIYGRKKHRAPRGKVLGQLLADYIAGMTDRFAIDQFHSLYTPRSFGEI